MCAVSIELAETYLCVQRDAWDAKASDPSALSAALEAIGAAGRAAWPGVEVASDALAAYLAERAPDQTEPLAALRAMQTTDLYLACGCARGDAKAIAHF